MSSEIMATSSITVTTVKESFFTKTYRICQSLFIIGFDAIRFIGNFLTYYVIQRFCRARASKSSYFSIYGSSYEEGFSML